MKNVTHTHTNKKTKTLIIFQIFETPSLKRAAGKRCGLITFGNEWKLEGRKDRTIALYARG